MKSRSSLLVLLLTSCPLVAAQPRGGILRGQIVNGTRGGPGKAERVALIRMASGLEPVATKNAVSGNFTLEDIPLSGEAPYLLQVTAGGVNYNRPVSFGRGYEAEATLTVYDATAVWKDITVSTARFLVRRDHDQLRVDKLYVVENKTEPKKTFFVEAGTFKFNLPAEMKELLSVSASAEGGMPVPQPSTPLPDGSGYISRTAFKPGRTEIAISYLVDYSSGRYEFKDRAYYPLPEVLALVSPADIKVEAAGLEQLQPDPEGRFVVLGAANLKVGDPIGLTLSGGSDHAPDILPAEGGGDQGDGGHQIAQLPDPTMAYKAIIVVLMAAALTFGLLTTLMPASAKATAGKPQAGQATAGKPQPRQKGSGKPGTSKKRK